MSINGGVNEGITLSLDSNLRCGLFRLNPACAAEPVSAVQPQPEVTVGGGGTFILVRLGQKITNLAPWEIAKQSDYPNCGYEALQPEIVTTPPQYGPLTSSFHHKTFYAAANGCPTGIYVDTDAWTYSWTSFTASSPIDPFVIGGNGSHSFKAELLPTGETTKFVKWRDSDGFPNIADFQQTLTPVGVNYNSSVVTETDPQGGIDNCYFLTSLFTPYTHITGGSWTVGSNNSWGADSLARGQDEIIYYRTHAKKTPAEQLPCSTTIPQQMVIKFNSGDPSQYSYGKINKLAITISTKAISASRSGVGAN